MIRNFAYVKAGSIAEAIKALSTKGAKIHAGGTDLLGCMRGDIFLCGSRAPLATPRSQWLLPRRCRERRREGRI